MRIKIFWCPCYFYLLNFSKYANVFTLKFGRPVYVTPASYLSLLDGFHNLMCNQQQQIRAAIERYRNGLQRLAEASEQVNRMQAELSLLQPKLVEASRQTDAMMKTIQQESAEVEKTSALIRADEVAANQQAAVSQALKAECEADLAEALPALECILSIIQFNTHIVIALALLEFVVNAQPLWPLSIRSSQQT